MVSTWEDRSMWVRNSHLDTFIKKLWLYKIKLHNSIKEEVRNCNNISGGTFLDVFFIWSINLGLKYFWSHQLSICGRDISPLTNIFMIYQILCHVSQESVCTIDRLFLFTHLTYKIHEPLSETQKQSVHISSIV